ncbi:cysteine proteinase [Lojkania enalia]|uniref:Cysteine proteinase n=1 Tax=Lojkania enalia TaxID=147567 RepID=A0A9P4N574_9PLEO|nr:cysteine proteinase [Didymosphaeria enalia]
MARPRKHAAKLPEFPILDANGLYAAPTRGDGNCLFNALSDQLYGHQNEHQALRDATIEHMRANSEFYRQYMTVTPVRRNPKRKVASLAPAVPLDPAFHSADELQRMFDLHLEKMGQPGEWADNMEVVAFASALNVHVRLWQADYHYTFSPRDDAIPTTSPAHLSVDEHDTGKTRPTLNVAYHTWEHYSSVRSLSGPHTGLPKVTIVPHAAPSKKRSSVERDDEDTVFRASKRRSPLPLFDSDSTPECSEASSDESNPSIISSQRSVCSRESELPPTRKIKLVLKLRNPPSITTAPASPVTATSPA